MLFAADTEVALRHAAALINTAPGYGAGGEDLPSVAALTAFMDEWGWTGVRPRQRRDLDAVHELRAHLTALWSQDEDDLIAGVNALLEDHATHPRLVNHDNLGWHIHASDSSDPPASRMAAEAAMALIDLVRADELGRLRICAAPDCDDAVIDLSKNRSRRYCEGTCANNAHVAAYRQRARDNAR